MHVCANQRGERGNGNKSSAQALIRQEVDLPGSYHWRVRVKHGGVKTHCTHRFVVTTEQLLYSSLKPEVRGETTIYVTTYKRNC